MLLLDETPSTILLQFLKFEVIDLLFRRFITINGFVYNKTDSGRNKLAAFVRPHMTFAFRIHAVYNHASIVVSSSNNEIRLGGNHVSKFRALTKCQCPSHIRIVEHYRHSVTVFRWMELRCCPSSIGALSQNWG